MHWKYLWILRIEFHTVSYKTVAVYELSYLSDLWSSLITILRSSVTLWAPVCWKNAAISILESSILISYSCMQLWMLLATPTCWHFSCVILWAIGKVKCIFKRIWWSRTWKLKSPNDMNKVAFSLPHIHATCQVKSLLQPVPLPSERDPLSSMSGYWSQSWRTSP